MIRIAVLVSGGGTNLGALLAAQKNGLMPEGEIVLVVSNNPSAYALVRAAQHGIPSRVIERNRPDFTEALLRELSEFGVELVVLAGFLSILDERVIRAYHNRIINIHPSLIPSFCGKGYYGLRVHEAALSYGVKVTGATVHYVNEIPDGGKILLQRAVSIQQGDTPEILQKRVMEEAEWPLIVEGTRLACRELNRKKTSKEEEK